MNLTRRSVLRNGAGALALGSLAGCLSSPEEGADGADGDDTGYAAFFAIWDWTTHVGGDRFAFENPVGVGQSGHGWSPGGNLATEIASTDAFVYLDMPEFAWAQDIANQIEADYDDVAVIDALDAVPAAQLLDPTDARGHDHDEDGNDGEGDHAGEGFDPHVWTDPVLVGEMVDGIADGLAAADPDGADVYAANADDYRERIDDLDAAFRRLVDDAARDVAVFAGHDSFRYLERRYGFELHSPVGVSPDESPSPTEIADTIDLVDGEGIDTILYDPFAAPGDEIPQIAASIIESSDATDAVPISPAEGTTAEWNETGWGWLDQMRELNLPSLRTALDAE
ncbi:metal ABC transporter substrate-binding protein [Salinilacihabitans rarus]|uniref:metal ABC transporter substrate-binding protein n=1 Tax=Salinilacihabitans rarus TaxID=2961596 RepID=UPI0020C8742F|nr:zinc ABC transporter substrate-binding protein [Salinilacihabitans rarus]